MGRPWRPTGTWVPAVLVAGLAGCLGGFDLGRRSYWIDEAFNVVLARDGWGSFLHTIGSREPSQAVYLVLFKPWTALVGEGELATRVPSVVAAMLASALLVDLGRQLFDRGTGVLAGIFLATNAAVVEWSQYARTYTLALLAATATTWLFLHALDRAQLRPWLLYGAAGAVSIYCHFYAGFVLVGHAAAYLGSRPRRPLRPLLVAWAVIAAGLAPFAAYLVAGTRSPVEWIAPLSAHGVWEAVWFASGTNAVLLAGAALGAVLLARRGRALPLSVLLLVGWAVAPLAGGIVVSLLKPALVARFLIVAAPAFALLAAAAIMRSRHVAVRVVLAACVLAAAGDRLANVYRQDPEDWRAAAREGRVAHARGSTIAFLPRYAWRAFDVYAPDVPWVWAPSGRVLTLFVSGSPAARPGMVDGFIGRAPYRLLAIRLVAPDLVEETWRRAPRRRT